MVDPFFLSRNTCIPSVISVLFFSGVSLCGVIVVGKMATGTASKSSPSLCLKPIIFTHNSTSKY